MNNSGSSKWDFVKEGKKVRVIDDQVHHCIPIGTILTVDRKSLDCLNVREHGNTLWHTDVEPYYSFNNYLKEIER